MKFGKQDRTIGRPGLAILAMLGSAGPAAAEMPDFSQTHAVEQLLHCKRLAAVYFFFEKSVPAMNMGHGADEIRNLNYENRFNDCRVNPEAGIKGLQDDLKRDRGTAYPHDPS